MATTIDALVDRIRSLCEAHPFAFAEAVSTEDFTRQPSGRGDQVFRVKARGGPVRGYMGFREERSDLIDLEVIRAVNADYDGARRALLKDASSLTAAIVRDGHVTSGEYCVPDQGRVMDVIGQPGASFLTLRLTVPVTYESNL